MSARCRGLFVAGTDTGVGKTHVASWIIRSLRSQELRVGAYKPVCSGAIQDAEGRPHWEDAESLHAALDESESIERVAPQRFLAPLAPPIAAAEEGCEICLATLDRALDWWVERTEFLVVEGAGGWLCPLTETTSLADWVTRWDLPVLIVARPGLGTINHTLLTIESIRSRCLTVAGVVLNPALGAEDCEISERNALEIEARSGVPVFGTLPYAEPPELRRAARTIKIAWRMLMRPIPDSPARSRVGEEW